MRQRVHQEQSSDGAVESGERLRLRRSSESEAQAVSWLHSTCATSWPEVRYGGMSTFPTEHLYDVDRYGRAVLPLGPGDVWLVPNDTSGAEHWPLKDWNEFNQAMGTLDDLLGDDLDELDRQLGFR